MKKVLIVGAGGVGKVVAHKCAQASDCFSEVLLASRTLAKCEAIAEEVKQMRGVTLPTYALDADDVPATTAFLEKHQPDLLINVALPYQDLTLMDACLAAGVDYLDTANYEPPEYPKFEYKWQWAYRERFKEAGLMALLGSGFDPGVTNVFCAYAQKHLFDEIHTVDILDVNAGSHGLPFATNFNPEINIREITQEGRYWEEGSFQSVEPMSVRQDYTFPEGIGSQPLYLLYHEELESLALNLRGLRRIRFWMGFGEQYLTHLRVLQNVGMTAHEPILFEGKEISPVAFLKAVLPDPASLAERYTGKICIGCDITGVKGGQPKRYFIRSILGHEDCYADTRSQAVSYSTGVPATVGAVMIVHGDWRTPGVHNIETCDPDPFLRLMPELGIPWQVEELDPAQAMP
ncbi:MAG: saccharopine dehydrogenase family protein [Verrucomicrobiota bacterium]